MGWIGMIVTSALIIWKGLMCVTGSESPAIVVLSGSMEPGFKTGESLHMCKDPILVNFLPSNEPVFMLSRQYPYEYRFRTGKDVKYCVKSSRFEQEYPQNSVERARLEQQVEREYVSIIYHHCRMERQRVHLGYVHKTPYCDALEKFQAMA